MKPGAKFCGKCGNVLNGGGQELPQSPLGDSSAGKASGKLGLKLQRWLSGYADKWRSLGQMKGREKGLWLGIHGGMVLLLVFLFIVSVGGKELFLPDKDNENTLTLEPDITETDSRYIPGIYTSELVLGNQSIDVEVIVDKDNITSIRMVNLNDAITTMYPLLQPDFDSICKQVYDQQSLEHITYTADSKYTSLVLLEAIQTALNKAMGTH